MKLDNIFTPELMICKASGIDTKMAALQYISNFISEADHRLNRAKILDALLKRERLGSTAIGHGTAVPHARVKDIRQPICIAMTLQKPIDFEAEDQQPVDLIFTLLVPENAEQKHLDILASLVEQLRNTHYRTQLRQANDKESLYRAVCGKIDIQKIKIGK